MTDDKNSKPGTVQWWRTWEAYRQGLATYMDDLDLRALAAAEVYRRHAIQHGWHSGQLRYHDHGDWADRRREERLRDGQPVASAWRNEAVRCMSPEGIRNLLKETTEA
jgi:hypothetical protein